MNTARANFLAENTRKSLDRPEFKDVAGYYFDCCQLNLCDNPLHGCRRLDKFGRTITGTNLLPLRDFLKRIVKLLHSRGRTVGAHQQQKFCPGIHGLCDYWLTGEELRALPLRYGARVYCDKQQITDEHLRTLSNYRCLSNIGVCMLVYTNRKKDNLLPAITRMLLEDIKCMGFFGDTGYQRMDKVWNAFAAYQVDAGAPHRYFEQTVLTSSDPEVNLTYYQCPGNKFLVIAGNLTPESRKVNIDLSKVKTGDFPVVDEVDGSVLKAENGKLTVQVAGRDFRLLGIR